MHTKRKRRFYAFCGQFIRRAFDRDYNECCSMKYKTTEQENIL